MAQRENFDSRTTAILAMAGSAIGLGNIWRFPYMAGQNGGAAFILVYILSALFICIPIFLCEAIIGRRAGKGTFGAMSLLAPRTGWKWLGLITVVTPLIILSYYSVVGGWSIEYLLKSLTFAFSDPSAGREVHSAAFSDFVSNPWRPVFFHTLFMAANAIVVVFGVKKGIEKFTKVTTPLLFVLMVLIMVVSLCLPGAKAGLEYLVKPDFSRMTSQGVLAAMGQSFFSLSLGVGTILTYFSYVSKKENILSTSLYTVGFDMVFAFISGLAIMPAVFSAGIEPGAGPGLIFETLPYIFSSFSGVSVVFSGIVAILFFVTIFFAALTSSISMLEVGVTYLVDERGMKRSTATLILFAACWVLGCLCAVDSSIFDFCDNMTSNFLMVLGSLLFVMFVGWKMKKAEVLEELGLGRSSSSFLYFLIRWVAPLAIIIIFVTTLVM